MIIIKLIVKMKSNENKGIIKIEDEISKKDEQK